MESKLINQKRTVTPQSYVSELSRRFELCEKDSIEFSIYQSGGQGITISRELIALNFEKNLEEKISSRLIKLPSHSELAIHSVVHVNYQTYFLPLIDFSFKSITNSNYEMLVSIAKYLDSTISIYSSGNSFHGYGYKLMSEKEWHRFLGMLLLLNRPSNSFENVDSRWIGHSLENGFSALRLSCNSLWYKKIPGFVMNIQF